MRNEDLALFVLEHPGISPRDLSDRFGVGQRAMRNHIGACNAATEGFAKIEHRRQGANGAGYYLDVLDKDAWGSWVGRRSLIRDGALPETAAERTHYILNDMLLRTDWITREHLAEVLFVSPASISASIKEAEGILAQFQLKLERRPHYGMRVSGSEMARRLCLASLAVKELDESADASAGTSVAEDAMARDLRHILMLDAVDECVTEALEKSRYRIDSFSFQNLLVHIGIALVRINKGCYVPIPDEQMGETLQTRAYEVAQQVARAIEERLDIHLPQEEIGYIAIHLAGKRTLAGGLDAGDDGTVISDEVWEVVSEILERIWQAFRFDLRGDLELRMNLAQHIVPLAARMRYHMSAENPMLDEIKTRYPLAYCMAVDAAGVLQGHYGSALTADEMGYLAISFALSLERQKTERPKKNILVVCASGRGSARLMEYRYRREFGEYLDRIEVCDVRHLDEARLAGIDYVFTTVPLAVPLPVPVREVGYFLEDQDVANLRSLFRGPYRGGAAGVLRYLDERLFFPHLRVGTKEEVLAVLCDAVRAVRDTSDALLEQVMLREDAAPTAFGGRISLPHPYTPITDESFLCVGLLDEPVAWAGSMVSVVFLLCVARSPEPDLDEFYDHLSDVMFDDSAAEKLLADRSFTTLEALFSSGATPQDVDC